MSILSLIIIFSGLLVCYLIYYFIFNIYEIDVSVNPKKLKPDNNSTAKISIKPINHLGIEVPFRKVQPEIKFISGFNLADIILEKDRLVIIKVKNKTGTVKMELLSKYSLLPNIVTIKID